MNTQNSVKTKFGMAGLLVGRISGVKPEEAHLIKAQGCDVETCKDTGDVIIKRPNAFVNQGLQVLLDRLFGINGPPAAITHIGLTDDNSTVDASTTDLSPAGSESTKAISPAASRSAQTVTAGATWTQADVAFVINKVGLLNGVNHTDVIDIIGGAGGASPYDQPFSLDLTSVTTWTLTLNIEVTAIAV